MSELPHSVFGYIFHATELVPEFETKRVQVRKPKSKKRRIRKKWAKDPNNWKTETTSPIYFIGRNIMAHPNTIDKIRSRMIGGQR